MNCKRKNLIKKSLKGNNKKFFYYKSISKRLKKKFLKTKEEDLCKF